VTRRRLLEAGGQACGNAARRADGVAGEKASEVDDVENVVEVLGVDLEASIDAVRFVDIGAGGSVDLKRGIDASTGKVDAIDDLLTVDLDLSLNTLLGS
jgi:hypothetical protein